LLPSAGGGRECFTQKFKRRIPVIVPLWIVPVVAGGVALVRSFTSSVLVLVLVGRSPSTPASFFRCCPSGIAVVNVRSARAAPGCRAHAPDAPREPSSKSAASAETLLRAEPDSEGARHDIIIFHLSSLVRLSMLTFAFNSV